MSGNFNSIFQNNAGYVEEMFSRYSKDPNSVGIEWRAYFEGFHEGFGTASALAKDVSNYENLLNQIKSQSVSDSPTENSKTELNTQHLEFELKCAEYVSAWKSFGHLAAKTNPLSKQEKQIEQLNPEFYGITAAQEKTQTRAGLLIGVGAMSFSELKSILIQKFAGTVGIEIEHIESLEEKKWLYKEIESIYSPLNKETQVKIYHELSKADALEKTIATKFIGKKRFSIEGADSQIPAVESFLDKIAELGAEECTIAIAHRGRLNLLVNVVGKPLEWLLSEFEGYPHDGIKGDFDVKYHFGYESVRKTRSGKDIRVSMPFNPSHLEYVGSVVLGDTRARQDLYYGSDKTKVASIVFHGDAAFSGQGIVFETTQMMSLNGYSIGGTIHVVANNQVGFTTDPKDSRSSTYCTDVAKVTGSPVFHVNADDVDALNNIMIIAAKYRQKFQKDFYVDILCFRRHGHNETDEPTFTQPLLYKIIKDKAAPYEDYAKYLSSKNIASDEELKAIYSNYRSEMNAVYDKVKNEHLKIQQFLPLRDSANYKLADDKEMLKTFEAKINIDVLKDLASKICEIPADFQCNPKLARIVVADRKEMAEGKKRIDWGMAELLAYSSLMQQGYSVRLVGEDAQRGTFSHRNVTLIDNENAKPYSLLSSFQSAQSKVEVINSLLSEEAAMGYEYGYSVRNSKCLTLWEGQFGDFANGAQVIIDQFIASGETKWAQTLGLVLLLPHGMEGQGAEHSSARLERFLQLCAEGNMQVCYLTNAAQIFHAFRRQVMRSFRKPLVIMSPKSFLRSRRASTSLEEIAQSKFEEILDDDRNLKKSKVERILLCSGKIALDLFDALDKEENKSHSEKIAVIRIEQLYPFAQKNAIDILSAYKNVKTIAWVQEEPANMGALSYIQPEIYDLKLKLNSQVKIVHFSRRKRATPAVGLEKLHFKEQEALIKAALESSETIEV